MNLGEITGDTYVKKVDFSRAVLWKTKELSLPISIFTRILKKKVRKMRFIGKDDLMLMM